ncbi:MAG: hypothetical protein AB2L11_04905 [Syntrophobacteraceae bacterium]
MSHHDHEHHGHHYPQQGALSETDKLFKMVRHWINHNEEHARSFRDWAKRAHDMGHEKVYLILEEVATGTELQSQNLEKALKLLKDAGGSPSLVE